MQCAHCSFDNPESYKYCGRCGRVLARGCPACGRIFEASDRFCGRCGVLLAGGEEHPQLRPPPLDEERKPVTALFSDLSGYTDMTVKLDPEEIKSIMADIFLGIHRIAAEYEGFIGNIIGDAVLIVFGVPVAHEDDAMRAVRAAMDIHRLVRGISPRHETSLGCPLRMHSGISTGIVVTGSTSLSRWESFEGQAISLASRLSDLAGPGEILVGQATFRQARDHFVFEAVDPAVIKGMDEPVRLYRVVSEIDQPNPIRRFSGLSAEFIGRKAELGRLRSALDALHEGKGAVIMLSGEAGTGKSRLVHEFKGSLPFDDVQWLDGRFYAYSRNIPYFLLINLLSKAWRIGHRASKESIKETIALNVARLIGSDETVCSSIGSLFSVNHPDLANMDPEFWKSRLFESLSRVLTAIAQQRPTVFFLEDFHWADPSSIEFVRFFIKTCTHPAIFLTVFRPPFSLFSSQELSGLGKLNLEISLSDMTLTESLAILGSLLGTTEVPAELIRFVEAKVEGNPFFLEEVVNALIESGILLPGGVDWKLKESFKDFTVPLTVNGVVSSRLDLLSAETKRVVQEASVIGRVFPLGILRKITNHPERLESCLSGLERLDLIRVKSVSPEMEYVFKHALTQDIVYQGLLKRDRRELHEKIARVIEETYADRIEEFVETIAFHFKFGESLAKAVDYLVRSGEKSLRSYSLEESHQYYQEAFDLLAQKTDRTNREDQLFLDILLKWMLVYYFRGYFKKMALLLNAHQELAESFGVTPRLGMFYMWLGMTRYQEEKFQDASKHLRRALDIGESLANDEIIANSCTWLAYTCADLGALVESLAHGTRALALAAAADLGHYHRHLTLGALGYAYWVLGQKNKTLEIGKTLLESGRKTSNIRSMVFGHWIIAFSHLTDGNYQASIESNEQAILISADPWYAQFPRLFLGLAYVLNGQFQKAEAPLRDLLLFCREHGGEILGGPAYGLTGTILFARGEMAEGLKILEAVRRSWQESQAKLRQLNAEYLFGSLYLKILERDVPLDLSGIVKNLLTLLKTVPFAGRKAEKHLLASVAIAREIGAKSFLGRACYDLGRLYRLIGRRESARECLADALRAFQECEAEDYLVQTQKALDSLDNKAP